MRTTLLTAVRTTVHADSHPVRQALYARLREASWPVRCVEWLHDRLGRTWASSVLVASYGVKSWLTISRDSGVAARVVAIAVHASARRRIADVATIVGRHHVSVLQTGPSAILRPSTLGRLGRILVLRPPVRRTFRLVRRVHKHHGFLVACRVANLLGCYARCRDLLATSRPSGVLVSSDSNPEEVGLASAARALSIPTIFVSHAQTTPVSPRLDFTLSILEGEAAVAAHSAKGPIRGAVVLVGVEGTSRPMDPARLQRLQPVIGIFAPKVVDWPTLSHVIEDCRQHFGARQVVIRWHPSMMERPHLQRIVPDLSTIVQTSRDASLPEVVNLCDWVVADAGSNVHLQVLKLGVPTVSVSGIGLVDDDLGDLYGFVANRVIVPPVARLRELPGQAVASFYGGDWPARFQRYDAAYLLSADLVGARLRDAINQAIGVP